MIVKGRLTPEGSDGEFTAQIMDRNRGIRVDHTTVPAFWVEALFDTEDIDKLATKKVYIMTREVTGENTTVLGTFRRMGEARRIAWQQKRPEYAKIHCWVSRRVETPQERLRLNASDISIVVTEYPIL